MFRWLLVLVFFSIGQSLFAQETRDTSVALQKPDGEYLVASAWPLQPALFRANNAWPLFATGIRSGGILQLGADYDNVAVEHHSATHLGSFYLHFNKLYPTDWLDHQALKIESGFGAGFGAGSWERNQSHTFNPGQAEKQTLKTDFEYTEYNLLLYGQSRLLYRKTQGWTPYAFVDYGLSPFVYNREIFNRTADEKVIETDIVFRLIGSAGIGAYLDKDRRFFAQVAFSNVASFSLGVKL